jgi:hypothetical protein
MITARGVLKAGISQLPSIKRYVEPYSGSILRILHFYDVWRTTYNP